MARGKQTCKILKEIRRQIAEANDIEFVTSECRYKGDCLGTCPKCEAEVRYLEQQLRSRQRRGKAIALAGISAASFALLTPNTVSAQMSDPDVSLPMGDIAVHAVIDTFLVKGAVSEMVKNNGVMQREPIIGATIINLRNNKGCASGIEGDFEIEVAPGDTLEVSFPGYHILKMLIKRWSDNLDIVLEADESVLTGDVLVLGGAISVKKEIIAEVCFRYNGTPFWRSYNLNNYPNVKLLPEQYDVSLTIKPISPNISKLESITLIPKAKI